jgi:hypothetical protein
LNPVRHRPAHVVKHTLLNPERHRPAHVRRDMVSYILRAIQSLNIVTFTKISQHFVIQKLPKIVYFSIHLVPSEYYL